MQTSAHTQTIDPRTLRVQRQRPLLDCLVAVAIGCGLAWVLVRWWSA